MACYILGGHGQRPTGWVKQHIDTNSDIKIGRKKRPQNYVMVIILCWQRFSDAVVGNKQEVLYPGHLWFPTDG